MSNKRDHSPFSSTNEPDNTNVNISHSSWLYKLTSTQDSSTTKPEKSQSVNEEDNKETQETAAESIPTATTQAEQDGKGPHHANEGNGIWTWLGYPGTQSAREATAPPAPESPPSPVVPIANDPKSTNQETTSDHKNDDSVTPQDPNQHHKSHYTARQSYWKSFFVSNKHSEDTDNQPDSVIISEKDDPTTTEQEEPTTNTEEKEAPLRKPPSRHNVVLPTFKSQFNKATVPYHHHHSSASIFSKAISAINSIIFTPKPASPPIDDDWQDISRLSTLLESLKTDALNKRIVIIGVHGWFPMKVCMLCA